MCRESLGKPYTTGREAKPSRLALNGPKDVRRVLEDDMLTPHQVEEYRFWPNEQRPRVSRAMEGISALKQFLEQECSAEFYEEAKYELGDTPDMIRRGFWDARLW